MSVSNYEVEVSVTRVVSETFTQKINVRADGYGEAALIAESSTVSGVPTRALISDETEIKSITFVSQCGVDSVFPDGLTDLPPAYTTGVVNSIGETYYALGRETVPLPVGS